MKRRLLEVLLLSGVVFTIAWVARAPGYDSAFSLLCAIAALLGLDHGEDSLLHRFFYTVRHNARRLFQAAPPPEASLTFISLSSGMPTSHRVRAVRLFADGAPTHLLWLLHECPDGEKEELVDAIDGHHPELFALDFDGDGFPELAIRWACGGHSRGLRLFRLTNRGFSRIEGPDIGSDWPEILWEDRDHDGKLEIYARQVNWHDREKPGPVTTYVFRGNSYEKSSGGT